MALESKLNVRETKELHLAIAKELEKATPEDDTEVILANTIGKDAEDNRRSSE